MGLFRKKHRGDVISLAGNKPGTYPGEAHQEVSVKLLHANNGKAVIRLTGYRLRANHPLLNEAEGGPWSDADFNLAVGDDVILDFKLDLPITLQ